MPEYLDDELEDDFDEESDLLVTDEEDELDDEELDESPRRGQRDPAAALKAELKAALAKVGELEDRLGNAIRVNGERLKERDREIEEWLEKMQIWANSKVQEAHTAGFTEGTKTVEQRLLPMLGMAEKTEYATDKQLNPFESSSPHPLQLDTRRTKVAPVDDLSAIVRGFTAQGVPIDQLDQTSAESVVASGAKYLSGLSSTTEERFKALEAKLEGRAREESGATRVSSGSGSTPTKPGRQRVEKELEQVEIDLLHARRTHNVTRATQLLKRKKELQAQLNRRAAA